MPKGHRSEWEHISATTGHRKMVHLSKFAEFYHKIGNDLCRQLSLKKSREKNIWIKQIVTSIFRPEMFKALRTGKIFQHLSEGHIKKKL